MGGQGSERPLPRNKLQRAVNAPLRSEVFAAGLLQGKVCIVSGAGTGIGLATARELAALGATVVGCGRRSEPLQAMVDEISAGGAKAEFETLDIRDEEAVASFMAGILERHSRIDVLVNNAGGQFLSPAEAISAKGFRTVTELNVQGTWNMTHAAATKAFIPQREGKVISVTLSPHNGMPGMVHSGASRAAVENMMKTLSVEWARYNVKTVALAAGQFDTEVIRTKYPKEVSETVASTIPLGRLGKPEEMAWLVAFLASTAGDFFSGCVITPDGARDNWFGSWPPEIYGRGSEPLAEERKPKP
jgi:citronellol/citronellal dehydrogenase